MRSLAGLGALLVVAATGCSGGSDGGEAVTTTAAPPPVERYISSSELGKAWPLTVPGGTLRCEGPGAVSFEADEGIVYAVNGVGVDWSRTNNLAWNDIASLRAEDVTAGGKMTLEPLIGAGLRLCRSAPQETVSTSG
jgi:uncharacterized protein DUF2511